MFGSKRRVDWPYDSSKRAPALGRSFLMNDSPGRNVRKTRISERTSLRRDTKPPGRRNRQNTFFGSLPYTSFFGTRSTGLAPESRKESRTDEDNSRTGVAESFKLYYFEMPATRPKPLPSVAR